jgi:hypothetical protein
MAGSGAGQSAAADLDELGKADGEFHTLAELFGPAGEVGNRSPHPLHSRQQKLQILGEHFLPESRVGPCPGKVVAGYW